MSILGFLVWTLASVLLTKIKSALALLHVYYRVVAVIVAVSSLMRISILRREHDCRTDTLLDALFVQSMIHLALLQKYLVLRLHVKLRWLAKLLTFAIRHRGFRLLQRH
jgi:nitrate/nitrite transporter NarK